MKIPLATLLSSAPLLAIVCFGQSGIIAQSSFRTFNSGGPIAGAPYSAEEITEHTQTLADGTHISERRSFVRMFRDSEGRTRTERQMGAIPGGAEAPVMIEISDPVAGYRYILEPKNNIVHRNDLPQFERRSTFYRGEPGVGPSQGVSNVRIGAFISATPPPGTILQEPSAKGPHPDFASESLGSQIIAGQTAEGRRTTVTYPAGWVGNDRPIVTSTEEWISPELKITVLSKRSDPRSGEDVTKIQNLSRAEPDASLFQPPAGAEIVDPGLKH